MTESDYVYARAADEDERGRVLYLEAWLDPVTICRLEAIGVGVGWRCAEVGAGAGSVARWLADRVGPLGSVVATDIDLRFLTNLPANVEVRRQDISREDLEPEIYDLVHCRVLLLHLAHPRQVLVRMLSGLKPGGWLLVEDADWGLCTVAGHSDAAWASDGLHDLWARQAQAGIRQPYFGRLLPGLVADLGLECMGGEATAPVTYQGDAAFELIRLTVRALRKASVAVGASEQDLDRLDSVLASPSIVLLGVASVSVRGRRSV